MNNSTKPKISKTKICIRTYNNYSHLGLKRNDIFLAQKSKVKTGDFVALKRKGVYHCGYVTFFEDLLMFDVGNHYDEPRYFHKSEVKIFGKIIGYLDNESTINGSFDVLPLKEVFSDVQQTR